MCILRDEEMVPGKYRINKTSAFNFSRKSQANLAFDSRFQKYSALKIAYWVIEFWPYLSWF